MKEQKPTGPWKLNPVHRSDSGSTLWNAVHVETGEEFGTPSYDSDAMQRRVDRLNAHAKRECPHGVPTDTCPNCSKTGEQA